MLKQIIHRINTNSILRSSLAIGFLTLLAKAFGYIEKVVLAYYFGTNYEIDVYILVISIIMSVYIFFREIIEPGFMHVFLKGIRANDEDGAWAFFNNIARLILLITVILSVFTFFFSNVLINIFAPGFLGIKRTLSVQLLKYAFPATVFLSITALTNIALNGKKKFVLPATGDLTFKVVILLALIFLFNCLGIYSLVYGLILGSVIKFGLHSIGLYKKYMISKLNFSTSYTQDAWKLTWPLVIGVTFSQFSSLIDNFFASYMKEGTIAALSFSKKIVELPVILFPYILSIVVFPYFSELSIAKEKEKLSGLLLQSLSWITVIFLPLSVFFNIFSYELVEIIFKRGAFDVYSTNITARSLAVYSFGLIFFALETIVVIFYFANSDTKTPIFVGVICVLENILLSYVFINIFGYTGIALSMVISKATKVLILFFLLKVRNLINFNKLLVLFFKSLLASFFLTLVFLAYFKIFKTSLSGGIVNKVLFVFLAFFVGSLVYAAFLRFIRTSHDLLDEFKR